MAGSVVIYNESSATRSNKQNAAVLFQERPNQDEKLFVCLFNMGQTGIGVKYSDHGKGFCYR